MWDAFSEGRACEMANQCYDNKLNVLSGPVAEKLSYSFRSEFPKQAQAASTSG